MLPLFRLLIAALLVAVAASCMAQTAEELETYVTYLASDALEGRDTGSRGYVKAAEYIAQECKSAGLESLYQQVPLRNGKVCHNVIAWIKGVNPDSVVVVGAHLDHTGMRGRTVYNGADDNASGSAAVLGLAKRFAKGQKPACTVVFLWFTGEEDGFIGSRYYVKNPLFPRSNPDIKKHKFMLNLDMVGRLRSTAVSSQDFNLPAILKELYEKYPFAKSITLINESGSDQVPFARKGIPNVFLHTGTHRDYHRPSDDANKINYQGLEKICDYAYDLLNRVMGTKLDYTLWSTR